MVLYWTKQQPTEIGEYLVETRGLHRIPSMGNKRLLAFWNGKSWSFTGQTFVRRLNIPNIHNYAPPIDISIEDIIEKADTYVSDFINPVGNEEDYYIAGYEQALIDLGYHQ